MPIGQGTDKDDVIVKGDDGSALGKKVGMVDDCLKVNVCNSDDIDGGDNGDFYLRVAKGLVPGHSYVLKFGYNSRIDDDDDYEDIWDQGGKYEFQTSAQTLNVRSNDNDDRTGDTGARTLEIQGLDGNFDPVTETINLNGTTNVTTTNTFLRVFRMKVLTAGSSGGNEGDITARYSSTNDVAAIINDRDDRGENQTLMAIYTIPNNKTGYLLRWWYDFEDNKSATIKLRVRPENEVFQVKGRLEVQQGGEQSYKIPLKITEKSDVLIEASSNDNDAAFSAGFDILLVDD